VRSLSNCVEVLIEQVRVGVQCHGGGCMPELVRSEPVEADFC
jgi:hypothetical protein